MIGEATRGFPACVDCRHTRVTVLDFRRAVQGVLGCVAKNTEMLPPQPTSTALRSDRDPSFHLGLHASDIRATRTVRCAWSGRRPLRGPAGGRAGARRYTSPSGTPRGAPRRATFGRTGRLDGARGRIRRCRRPRSRSRMRQEYPTFSALTRRTRRRCPCSC